MSNNDEDKIDIEFTEEELDELIKNLPLIIKNLTRDVARQI